MTLDPVIQSELSLLSEFDRRLSEARSLADLGQLARDTLALREIAQIAFKDRYLSNQATVAYGRVARKAGAVLIDIPRGTGPGRGKKNNHGGVSFSNAIDEARIAATTAQRWQKLALIDQDKFDEWCSKAEKDELDPITSLISPGAHVGNNSGDNEWYTPGEYIEAARWVLDGIDLDPASTPAANEVVKATTFYTKSDNGLDHHWQGTVWLNPPYAQPWIDKFSAKLVEHFKATDISAAVVLVNNATETGWFNVLVKEASAICFPEARLSFWSPDKPSAAPLQGQTVLYFGNNIDDFISAFRPFGWLAVVAK